MKYRSNWRTKYINDVRNSNNKTIGTINFDTTLGKPIWYKGDDMTNPDKPFEIWVDATGTQV